jgi:hypothetical protein
MDMAENDTAALLDYRDGLMIALLAARPLRRRNLAMITIGRQLIRVGDAWDLIFAAEETKTGQPIEAILPDRRRPIWSTISTPFARAIPLVDLREKTRRDQLGCARTERIPGGLAYGYEVVPSPSGSHEAGERRTNLAEAVVVQRTFRDYAAGRSPRRIARDLNAEGVPGPGGRSWGDTTIRGQMDRGTGILNTLYIGRLSWNRCSYVKDPRTGKRVARVNAIAEREVVEVLELCIVEQSL